MDMYQQHLRRYYTDMGNTQFVEAASPGQINARRLANAHIYLIHDAKDLVGVLEFDHEVLKQFFIVDDFRGRGYGRMAINWLKGFFRTHNLGKAIVVHASPNAYLAFDKVGFIAVGGEEKSETMISKRMELPV
jgi:GNAT superfamily N-acetyltransferase